MQDEINEKEQSHKGKDEMIKRNKCKIKQCKVWHKKLHCFILSKRNMLSGFMSFKMSSNWHLSLSVTHIV